MRSATTTSPTASAAQERELASFLLWVIGIAVLATIVFVILWQRSTQALFLALAGLAFAVVIGLSAGSWLARRGAVRQAIGTVFGTLVGAACVCMVAAPALLPILVLVPLLAVATALPYVDRLWLDRLLWITGGAGVFLALLSVFNPFAQAAPPGLISIVVPIIMPCVLGAVLLLLGQFHRRLIGVLARSEQAVAALQRAQEGLETEVQTRTADLRRAVAEIAERADSQATLLAEVQQQRDTIRELSVPVLPVTQNALVVPLVGALDTVRLAQLREQALYEIEHRHARKLILDVTGVPVVDTFVAQGLVQVMQAARLLGAHTVLVGIRPEVAQTLVGLGVDLSAIKSYADLASAIA